MIRRFDSHQRNIRTELAIELLVTFAHDVITKVPESMTQKKRFCAERRGGGGIQEGGEKDGEEEDEKSEEEEKL